MSNLCIYIILAILLYYIFYRNKESMDDTNSSLRDKLLKKNNKNKEVERKKNIKKKIKEKLELSHQKNLNLIKEVSKITKDLDDGMREINSW